MFFILIWGLIVGSTIQYQDKYDYCKSKDFEGEYCKTPKKLNSYETK